MIMSNSRIPEARAIPERAPFADARLQWAFGLLWHARFVSGDEHLFRQTETELRETLLNASIRYGEPGEHPVREVDADTIDARSFSTVFANSPVVVRGFMSGTRAVRDWSFDHLAARYGHTTVPAAEQNGSSEAPCTQLTIQELIRDLRASDVPRRYLMASSTLLEKNRALLDDLDLQRLPQRFGKRIIRAEVFIGGADVGSPFHCASSGNLFCNIHGSKEWLLAAPQHSMWMYPLIGRHKLGVYVNSPIQSDREEEIDREFPLYRYIPRYRVTLQPGDVLYVPPWWWHEVKNLSETIGVPIRLLDSAGGYAPFSLLQLSMLAASPKSAKQLLPAAKHALGRFLKPKSSMAGLYLSDELMKASQASARAYDRGWWLRPSQERAS